MKDSEEGGLSPGGRQACHVHFQESAENREVSILCLLLFPFSLLSHKSVVACDTLKGEKKATFQISEAGGT